MNFLIAHIHGNKKEKQYSKILNIDNLYSEPVIGNEVPYSPRKSLHNDDDWYVIKEFSKTTYSLDLFTKDDSTYKQLDISEIKNVNELTYLCWIKEAQNGNKDFYFQKTIPSRCVIQTKKELFYDTSFNIKKSDPHITIEDEPDAFYNQEKDCLYFKKLEKITSIFKNINELSKEASEEELNCFIMSTNYSFGFKLNKKQITKRMSRQIKESDDFINSLSQENKNQFIKYLNEYCPDIKHKSNKYNIPDIKNLKLFLEATEENFYKTPITNEKRIVDTILKPEEY